MIQSDGRRFPVELDVDPVTLPGAPTTGKEAEAARELAEVLDDVRLAAALLQAAATKASLAVAATPYIKFIPLAAQRTWVRPLIAACEPLLRISKACDAFEGAIAGAPPRGEGGRADVEQPISNEIRDLPAGAALDEKMRAIIATVSAASACLPSPETRRAIAAADAAMRAVGAALKTMDAIGRVASVIGNCAIAELTPISSMTPEEKARFARAAPPPLSAADKAALAAAKR